MEASLPYAFGEKNAEKITESQYSKKIRNTIKELEEALETKDGDVCILHDETVEFLIQFLCGT